MSQQEQHSLTSLAARVGVSRGALMGAILSGRLPATKSTIGAREIYTLTTEAVVDYKNHVLRKLQERVARITTDPVRAAEITASALGRMKAEVELESAVWTPRKLADHFSIGLEAASYLLGKYAERIENGFRVSDSAMQKIRRHVDETRGSGTIKNKGGVFVP
jgi:hypothetical protein